MPQSNIEKLFNDCVRSGDEKVSCVTTYDIKDGTVCLFHDGELFGMMHPKYLNNNQIWYDKTPILYGEYNARIKQS